MCSISGFIVTSQEVNIKAIAKHYVTILEKGRERGQDSVGVATLDKDGNCHRAVCVDPGDYSFVYSIADRPISILIGNNRAEPTTEYVADKTSDDIQPFGDQGIYVTHNGVIANDQILKEKYGIETNTRIDTAVFPRLVYKVGFQLAVRELIGSFALAMFDARQPRKLWLACNYKPIYIQARPDLGAIFFASRPHHLQQETDISKKLLQNPVLPLSPYHTMEIDAVTSSISQDAIYRRASNKKALVICSGGLDSTTTAKWAQNQGYNITLLHFLYKCRAENREVAAVRQVAKALNCECRFEDLNWLGRLGGSSLTDFTMQITSNETGAEFAHEWVPARNLIFTALAAGLCDRYSYDTLIMGLNLEEGGAYPDNTVEFYEALDHVCNIGTFSRPQILSPLGNLVKHQIVQLALEIGAPIHHSWSCYYGGEYHCGQCGPCYMRRTAFKMLGLQDSIYYER